MSLESCLTLTHLTELNWNPMKLKIRRKGSKCRDAIDHQDNNQEPCTEEDIYRKDITLSLHDRVNGKISHVRGGSNTASMSPASSDDESDDPVPFHSFIKGAMTQGNNSDDSAPNISFTDVDSDNCDIGSDRNTDFHNYMSESSTSTFTGTDDEKEDEPTNQQPIATKRKSNQDEKFTAFRLNYLIVHLAIMLADGLQGKDRTMWTDCDLKLN